MELKLKHGTILIDDDDYARLSGWVWRIERGLNTCYVAGRNMQNPSPRSYKKLHRVILNLTDTSSPPIDHINHNGLDNRRQNLRICAISENAHNTVKRARATSKLKGVSWHKRSGRWQAQITVNREYNYLGIFDTEEEAAKAYEIAARQLHGDFACMESVCPGQPLLEPKRRRRRVTLGLGKPTTLQQEQDAMYERWTGVAKISLDTQQTNAVM